MDDSNFDITANDATIYVIIWIHIFPSFKFIYIFKIIQTHEGVNSHMASVQVPLNILIIHGMDPNIIY